MFQECHYAGHMNPQFRIDTVKEGAVYFFSSEDNIDSEKIKNKHSFINPHKGIGIYKQEDKLFAGVNLYGLQTVIFLNRGCGKHACFDTCVYPEEALMSFEDIKDLVHESTSFVEMKSLDEVANSLDDLEKMNLLKEFEKVLAKANNGLMRISNPDKVEADNAIVESIRCHLS